MNRKKIIFNTSKFLVAFAFISLAYQNCGSFDSGDNGFAAVSSANNGDIVPLPNTKTASVTRASRTLDNLVSCLGVQRPSNGSLDAYRVNRGSISEEGLANSVNQPMIKSIASVAAEVCEDLFDLERNQSDDERVIFKEVNLGAGGYDRSQMILSAKRIARSCWGRNASADEITMIVDDIDSSFTDDRDNATTTKNKLIYMCTAMASSFATHDM